VIHSPTITSTKYWPGDLGRFSTHAVVFARLLVKGKDYGTNAFIVQLRDLNTFKRLDGIKTGDIGSKFGYVAKDNGWATFDKVRIPRMNMLMEIVELNKEGAFTVKGDPKVLYTTMMLIRTTIILECPHFSARTLVIALRYSAVRRQFATIKGSKSERKIIDYQTFQADLTPLLAKHMTQMVVSTFVRNEFHEMQMQVYKGEF